MAISACATQRSWDSSPRFEFVPSIGPVLAAIPGVAIAFRPGSSWLPLPNLWFACWWRSSTSQFSRLKPLSAPAGGRRAHPLHPAIVIVGALAGALGGILGILLAAPTIAGARTLGGYAPEDLRPGPVRRTRDARPPAAVGRVGAEALDRGDPVRHRWDVGGDGRRAGPVHLGPPVPLARPDVREARDSTGAPRRDDAGGPGQPAGHASTGSSWTMRPIVCAARDRPGRKHRARSLSRALVEALRRAAQPRLPVGRGHQP